MREVGRSFSVPRKTELRPVLLVWQPILTVLFQAAGRAGKPACRQDCLPHVSSPQIPQLQEIGRLVSTHVPRIAPSAEMSLGAADMSVCAKSTDAKPTYSGVLSTFSPSAI